MSDVFVNQVSACSLRKYSLDCELKESSRLDGPPSGSRDPLTSVPQCWDYMCVPPHAFLNMGAGF